MNNTIPKMVEKAIEISNLYNEFKILRYYNYNKNYKIELECLNCGYKFNRYAHSFVSSPHSCPNCHPKGTSQKITLQEAQRRIDNVYGTGYLTILEYNGNNIKTNIRCEKCSNIFQSVPASLWRGRLRGCPICEKTKSLGECRIERFLREHNIQFRAQERFLNCKDILCLPFDFYLPQFNTCIEFQGEQHYNKNSLMWSDILQKHDIIKKQFCKDNNIELIEIPWYDINNIDKYLIKFENK